MNINLRNELAKLLDDVQITQKMSDLSSWLPLLPQECMREGGR